MTILEQIRDVLLNHQGKENTIKSEDIASIVEIDPGPSTVNIRKEITKAIRKFHLPVASNSKGYYLLREEDEDELNRYVKSLRRRALKQIARAVIIQENFNSQYNRDDLELTGEIIDTEDLEED